MFYCFKLIEQTWLTIRMQIKLIVAPVAAMKRLALLLMTS